MAFRAKTTLSVLSTLAVAAMGFAAPASALQTKSYVVSFFHIATHSDTDACPHGLNPEHVELWTRSLKGLGYSQKDIDELLISQRKNGKTIQEIVRDRGLKPGQENIFAYPFSAPDPNLHTVEGRYSYGFNLDGKTDGGFEDPDTHEQGVDNNLYKAFGCLRPYHVSLPDRPQYENNAWLVLASAMPAWLLSVSGDDLTKDGPVTVTIARALEHTMQDARGQTLADSTFRIDPNPRSHNVMRGALNGGTLSIEPTDIFLEAEPHIISKLHLLQAHLRLTPKPDGNLEGYIGGYTPWFEEYWAHASNGFDAEESGIDMPGLYYALQRLADGPVDPKTGERNFISATWRIELVPAIVADPHNALAGLRR